MVYETGPFVCQEGIFYNYEGTSSFEVNKYAWNMKANLLFLSSPGGVGFSESNRGIDSDDGTTA